MKITRTNLVSRKVTEVDADRSFIRSHFYVDKEGNLILSIDNEAITLRHIVELDSKDQQRLLELLIKGDGNESR